MKPALVILAAGASRRLGTCKALVDLGGRTPLERLVAAGAALDEVPPLVVTGPHDGEIRARAPAGVELVHNPRWAEGRTGSLARAVERRPGRDLLVAPVDVPLVEREIFDTLLSAWREAGAPARGWLAPAVEAGEADGEGAGSGTEKSSRFGHPVVVGRDLARGVLEASADAPLRRIRALATPVAFVTVTSLSILDDLDEPADLERLRARLEAGREKS